MARVFGAAAQFLAERFKGIFRAVETQTTVGSTAVEIVPYDAERVALVVANHGAADVYMALTNEVSVTRGVRLAAGGGVMSVNVVDDGNLSAMSWWGISAVAGNVVYSLGTKREVALSDLEA